MITGRLIIAIVTTLIEEAALAAVVIWCLPHVGINLHVGVLIALMVALAAYAYEQATEWHKMRAEIK